MKQLLTCQASQTPVLVGITIQLTVVFHVYIYIYMKSSLKQNFIISMVEKSQT